MFTLDDVLTATGGRRVAGWPDALFHQVAIDSRTVTAGDLFIAFRGQKHDGHEFILQAFTRGASGALVESLPDTEPWSAGDWSGPPVILVPSTSQALQDLAVYWRGRHDVAVVGVTGSVGKTSTK